MAMPLAMKISFTDPQKGDQLATRLLLLEMICILVHRCFASRHVNHLLPRRLSTDISVGIQADDGWKTVKYEGKFLDHYKLELARRRFPTGKPNPSEPGSHIHHLLIMIAKPAHGRMYQRLGNSMQLNVVNRNAISWLSDWQADAGSI